MNNIFVILNINNLLDLSIQLVGVLVEVTVIAEKIGVIVDTTVITGLSLHTHSVIITVLIIISVILDDAVVVILTIKIVHNYNGDCYCTININ